MLKSLVNISHENKSLKLSLTSIYKICCAFTIFSNTVEWDKWGRLRLLGIMGVERFDSKFILSTSLKYWE